MNSAAQKVPTVLAMLDIADASPERQTQLAGGTVRVIDSRSRRSGDSRLEAKLQRMVDHIADANDLGTFDYKVRLLEDDTANAFTPGAGYIYVNTGLIRLASTEAMMAMILAHEMAHVEESHPIDGMFNQMALQLGGDITGEFLASAGTGPVPPQVAAVTYQYTMKAASSGFSRSAETEADELGFRYYHTAGYEPVAASRIFESLAATYGDSSQVANFFEGSHPRNQDRVAKINQWVFELPQAEKQDGVDQTQEWASLTRRYR